MPRTIAKLKKLSENSRAGTETNFVLRGPSNGFRVTMKLKSGMRVRVAGRGVGRSPISLEEKSSSGLFSNLSWQFICSLKNSIFSTL